VDGEQVTGQVVAAGAGLGLHQLAQVAAVVGDVAGDLDLAPTTGPPGSRTTA
jgi:hypothetical protein